MIIRKVYKVRSSNQLLVTIPKDNNIEEGDYVRIEKAPVNFETGGS